MILKPKLITKIEPGHWASKGLVGAWLFNEGDGDLAYDTSGNGTSGNGNHGTLFGDTHSVPGKFGPALDFDGTLDWVNLGDDFTSSNDFTIIIWCKMGVVSGAEDYLLDNSAGAVGFILRATNWSNDINFISFKSGPTTVWSTLTLDLTDTWHQLVITRTNVEQRIYRDGILATSNATGASLVTTTTPLVLGAEHDGDSASEGQVDHILIYNRALTVGEIKELYRDPFQMFKRNL